MSNLPKGIYYEPARNRYRVRVYKFGVVTHCSYHKTQGAARLELRSAREARELITKRPAKVKPGYTDEPLLSRLT